MAELTNLKRKRGTCKGRLTQLETLINGFRDSGQPVEILYAKIEFVQNTWSQFDDIQSQIEELDENDTDREAIEERYCTLIGKARAVANAVGIVAQNLGANNQRNNELKVKLPVITLPTFDGNPEKWLEFRDSFQGLVDTNQELSSIQRMHYLRSALKGRAAEVVQSLETSAENYVIAWDLLKKRFEDKRAIASRHLQLLLDIPTIQKESGLQLRQNLDSMLRHIRALTNLEANTWDAIVVHILSSKLDAVTKREWRSEIKAQDNVTVETLTDFLEERCLIIEPEIIKQPSGKPQTATRTENKPPAQTKKEQSNSFATTGDEKPPPVRKCSFCEDESHAIYACKQFRELTVPQRQNAVKERRLCRNCLRANHIAVNCSSTNCKKCNVKHNTLLHPEGQSENAMQKSTETTQNTASNSDRVGASSSINYSSFSFLAPSRVLLSTAQVWFYDKSGKPHEARVLLDSGSQLNFMARELCERLKLDKQNQRCSVSGLGAAINLTESTSAVMQSKHTAYKAKLKFLVTERIIEKLPLSAIEIAQLKIPANVKLADNTFHVPGKIDVILGATIFWNLLCIGQVKLGKTLPILQKTHLGWIVSGDIGQGVQQATSVCCLSADVSLHKQVERFWDIEEVDRAPTKSANDEMCEADFMRTHRRDGDGRFVVSLPFKGDPSELGESRHNALKRFYKIEQKLNREPDLRQEYVKFMDEYVKLGHMTAVNESSTGSSSLYYIPHHAVVTTVNDRMKLRVVFDASAKSTSGKSLNDILRVGPTIQPTLFTTVLRFRQYQYVMTADIVKMYRQVNIRQEHRDLQRILWRSDSNQPVQEYQLNTVPYGLASAPFLAIRALQQAGHEARISHPVASEIICRDFYVDDLLTGGDELHELQALKDDLIELLGSAGFELAKWNSNEPTLFGSTSEDVTRLLNIGEPVKTLGLSWASAADTLQYQVNLRKTNTRITKRMVLSIASQIFDPLGLVGPATIRAKILLQRMWQLNLSWDESLPMNIHTEWVEYLTQLSAINDIVIPRVIVCREPVRIQIHGFSDASESAYGACAYLRSIDNEGTTTVRLLCAKSKVAPLKTICVPRLELCGALLLARLVKTVTDALTLPIHDRYYWCDSTIVLAWIHGEPYLRKTFVANRITEIHELTSREMWHHVRTGENPADVISRGVSPAQLAQFQLWWDGPDWLRNPEEQLSKEIPQPIGEIPETKPNIATFTQIIEAEDILVRFSSLARLKRVVAYCLRWRKPQRAERTQQMRPLTVEELDRAMKQVIILMQAREFTQELKDLKTNQRVSHDSPLLTLHPFLDDDGIIRVGGRLCNAEVAYSRQHPIVLPPNHHVTLLLIRDEHYRNLHAGAQALLSTLQELYWILSARSVIRKVLHKCIVCCRARPVNAQHLMGDLPEYRVRYSRTFSNVGIDYGGPFILKLSRNKTCKSYICIFVCMSTKAIHIELVSDLSTPAFLNALKRFIARRGKCAHVYSDNGSNFKGANNELRDFYALVNEPSHREITERFCSDQAIQWHVIPPYSPHMGGLWEAGIKSVKTHLRKVLSEALLTFEEMYTVLVQTEAVLNSRPLTPLSNDPTDLNALTPGHFLIGEPLNAIPQSDFVETPSNRLTRFQYLAKLVQTFWARWSKEYLSTLQQRFKWNREDCVSDVKEGTMVLLRDDHAPSMQWALGRITECHEGADQNVRVVSVKTVRGTVQRALAKLCILPIEV